MTQITSLRAQSGSVGVGDEVLCRGKYSTVHMVRVHSPQTHPDSPIVNDMCAVEVITFGGTRWLGGQYAAIESDLRVHWERASSDLGVTSKGDQTDDR